MGYYSKGDVTWRYRLNTLILLKYTVFCYTIRLNKFKKMELSSVVLFIKGIVLYEAAKFMLYTIDPI